MRIGYLAATGTAVAALSLGAALPAAADGVQANARVPKASGAKVMVYRHANFQGRREVFTRAVPNLAARGWDHVGAVVNQGRRTVVLYTGKNYHGAALSVASGKYVSNAGDRGLPHGSLRFR
ncbi:peptidase inhibitor family I36 protein [Streptomyces sp. NPDC059649]|uniref:peptidase inhibitor family I36 protein n=1 Tax=Streptomyces sp. NPDC059649 TaxID=3346895 RepID=UPI0036AB6F6C